LLNFFRLGECSASVCRTPAYLALLCLVSLRCADYASRVVSPVLLVQWFSTFFGRWTIKKKLSDGLLCYADTSSKTSRNCTADRSVNLSSKIYGTLCGPIGIPGGLGLVVHLNHVENHCSSAPCCRPLFLNVRASVLRLIDLTSIVFA